ncbi:hypothetical protein D3C74_426480 [compost metagenome]
MVKLRLFLFLFGSCCTSGDGRFIIGFNFRIGLSTCKLGFVGRSFIWINVVSERFAFFIAQIVRFILILGVSTLTGVLTSILRTRLLLLLP